MNNFVGWSFTQIFHFSIVQIVGIIYLHDFPASTAISTVDPLSSLRFGLVSRQSCNFNAVKNRKPHKFEPRTRNIIFRLSGGSQDDFQHIFREAAESSESNDDNEWLRQVHKDKEFMRDASEVPILIHVIPWGSKRF